jgi:hypothetical protein
MFRLRYKRLMLSDDQRYLYDPSSHEWPADYQPPPVTRDQKRRGVRVRIEGTLRWHPELSDRAVARAVGCHHTTVAVMRKGGGWSKRKRGKSFWLNGWR